MVGINSSSFAATRSLVQLRKGARLENEVWEQFAKEADGQEKGTYQHWFLASLGLISFCQVTICYCDPGINDPAFVLQVLGENGSKLIEWHGCHAN